MTPMELDHIAERIKTAKSVGIVSAQYDWLEKTLGYIFRLEADKAELSGRIRELEKIIAPLSDLERPSS